MRTLKSTLTVMLLVLAAATWAAWMRSPERAVLIRDREIEALQQSVASDRASLVLGAADCLADRLEFGRDLSAASCAAERLQAELARARIEAATARMQELQHQADLP